MSSIEEMLNKVEDLLIELEQRSPRVYGLATDDSLILRVTEQLIHTTIELRNTLEWDIEEGNINKENRVNDYIGKMIFQILRICHYAGIDPQEIEKRFREVIDSYKI